MQDINRLIGNTPMVSINCKFRGVNRTIFSKLEWYNMTGSIKDRPAYFIIKKARDKGRLKENQPIIEATSGNMGISIAAIGTYFNHPVHIFMPDWMSDERKKILKGYGAILHEVSREDGGFQGAIRLADELSEEINGFRTNQFSNPDNVESHYIETANEILRDMGSLKIDGFVSGIGTGGTLMGISKRLREVNPEMKSYAFEPDTLSIMSKGHTTGEHKIAGVGDDFIPKIVDRNLIDEILLINDADAINMSRKLAKELGLGVGISSGANFLAAVLANEDGKKNIVTVFPDDSKKYLSTDLSLDIDMNSEFISNQIELVSVN